MFQAVFIINPNVTVKYLSFDIITTDDLLEESSVDGEFLINGTMPPLAINAPNQSMYLLVITTQNLLDINDIMDITFNLSAFINTSLTFNVDVILYKIGKVLLY